MSPMQARALIFSRLISHIPARANLNDSIGIHSYERNIWRAASRRGTSNINRAAGVEILKKKLPDHQPVRFLGAYYKSFKSCWTTGKSCRTNGETTGKNRWSGGYFDPCELNFPPLSPAAGQNVMNRVSSSLQQEWMRTEIWEKKNDKPKA